MGKIEAKKEKFARLVFEETVSDSLVRPDIIIDRLKASIVNWLKYLEENPMGAFEDIEISEYPYERQE